MRSQRLKAPPLFVRGMFGLGDNIMQRPFIRAACAREEAVYLQTPFPELYTDLPNLRPVRSLTRLRTQMRNERLSSIRWWPKPGTTRAVRISYGHRDLSVGSISEAMARSLPLGETPYRLDLPAFPKMRFRTEGRPIAVVRPVTERGEWHNSARSPRPEYVNEIAARLMETHHVVALADIQPGHEWLVGEMPLCDTAFVRGELTTVQMLNLISRADIVVGGVGWIVPAALALGVRAWVVLGGHGAHNAPEKIIDPRADASRIGFAMPDSFCRCSDMRHPCKKTISGSLEQFEAWDAQQRKEACSRKSSAPLARTG